MPGLYPVRRPRLRPGTGLPALGPQALEPALELPDLAPALARDGTRLALGILRRADRLAGGLEPGGRLGMRSLRLLEGRTRLVELALRLGEPLSALAGGGLLAGGGGAIAVRGPAALAGRLGAAVRGAGSLAWGAAAFALLRPAACRRRRRRGPERAQPHRLALPREAACRQLLAGLLVHGRGVQRRADALAQGGSALPGLARDRLGAVRQRRREAALLLHRLAQRGRVAAGEQRLVRLAQPLPGREERVGLLAPPPHRLVQRPGPGARLAQPLHAFGGLALALAAQPLRELVAVANELVERDAVEPVDLRVELHQGERLRRGR